MGQPFRHRPDRSDASTTSHCTACAMVPVPPAGRRVVPRLLEQGGDDVVKARADVRPVHEIRSGARHARGSRGRCTARSAAVTAVATGSNTTPVLPVNRSAIPARTIERLRRDQVDQLVRASTSTCESSVSSTASSALRWRSAGSTAAIDDGRTASGSFTAYVYRTPPSVFTAA